MNGGYSPTVNITIAPYPRLPSRIRKMSCRRRKIAIKRYLTGAVELTLNRYVGMPYSDDLQCAMTDSMMVMFDTFVPKFTVEVAP